MDLNFSKEEQDFREEVRTWLAENIPHEQRPLDGPDMLDFDKSWQRKQYDGGWAGISWPKEYGGRGLSTIQQLIWFEEYARAEAPWIGAAFVGINHGGPTLIARATQEQKAFHLPKILRGDVMWCQGFSEPEAGSDLASLKTHAEIDGDELVVTGQKVWTSFAHVADYQELLVRTDRDAPKHKGITWVICDMHTPGIEVSRINTMSRVPEFCEVFYNEVRIPIKNVVGDLNEGWSVAMSTLSFERGTGFMAEQVELARRVEELVEEAKTRTGPDGKRPLIADDNIAHRLAEVRAEVAALRSMTYLSVSRNIHRDSPGAEGSMLRIYNVDCVQKVYRLGMEILGDDAMLFADGLRENGWTRRYLRSFAASIAGGSAEIQRSIVGERVLGLPR